MENQLKEIEKIILEIREAGIMAGNWEYYEDNGKIAGIDWTKLNKAKEAFSKIRQILDIH